MTLGDFVYTAFGFATLWVGMILGLRYVTRPRRSGVTRPCCLEAPCSDACAERLAALREAQDVQWGRVVAELRGIVTAGESAYPGPGEE
jgi:hypothetical protein